MGAIAIKTKRHITIMTENLVSLWKMGPPKPAIKTCAAPPNFFAMLVPSTTDVVNRKKFHSFFTTAGTFSSISQYNFLANPILILFVVARMFFFPLFVMFSLILTVPFFDFWLLPIASVISNKFFPVFLIIVFLVSSPVYTDLSWLIPRRTFAFWVGALFRVFFIWVPCITTALTCLHIDIITQKGYKCLTSRRRSNGLFGMSHC